MIRVVACDPEIGGAALDDNELVSKFAKTIPDLCREGHKLVIVHGGGATLSRTLNQLGCGTTFIDGLRVTDSKTRDVAMMVLAGLLNKQLVAAIGDAGQPSIGICGGDLHIFRATRKTQPDLGYVGEVCEVDIAWIERLWSAGAVPVVASLALGFDGEYYNVNADQLASACAVACGADALVYLTDVAGVKDAEGTVIRGLDVNAIPAVVEEATVSGGMLPSWKPAPGRLRMASRVCLSYPPRAPKFFPESLLTPSTAVRR
jgi:acetylglutamate kinase